MPKKLLLLSTSIRFAPPYTATTVGFASMAMVRSDWNWLAVNCPTPAAEHVPDYLARVNELFGSSDFAVGFSYFMRKDLDEAVIERIWRHDIMPTVEEFHANDRAKIKQFELDAIRRAVAGSGQFADIPAAPVGAGAEVAP